MKKLFIDVEPIEKFNPINFQVKNIYGKYYLECRELFKLNVLLKSKSFIGAKYEAIKMINLKQEEIKNQKMENITKLYR